MRGRAEWGTLINWAGSVPFCAAAIASRDARLNDRRTGFLSPVPKYRVSCQSQMGRLADSLTHVTDGRSLGNRFAGSDGRAVVVRGTAGRQMKPENRAHGMGVQNLDSAAVLVHDLLADG